MKQHFHLVSRFRQLILHKALMKAASRNDGQRLAILAGSSSKSCLEQIIVACTGFSARACGKGDESRLFGQMLTTDGELSESGNKLLSGHGCSVTAAEIAAESFSTAATSGPAGLSAVASTILYGHVPWTLCNLLLAEI